MQWQLCMALTVRHCLQLNAENEYRKSSGGAPNLDSVFLFMGRKGVDQCNSKRNEISIHEEDGEARLSSLAVMPPRSVEIFHGTKLLITDEELMGSRISSVKDDSSDSFDTASKEMTSSTSSSSNSTRFNKSRKWVKFLNVWGLLSRQKQCKSAREKFDRWNVDHSIADPSKKIGREGNGEEVSSDPEWKLVRSDSVLDRNCSARYSPDDIDNGVSRFYVTPLRSSRRSKFEKHRRNKSDSLACAVLRI